MAWIEARRGNYRLKFRHAGRNFSVALKTECRREADVALSRLEENLRLVERGRLELPPGADIGVFLLSDGKLNQKPVLANGMNLEELFVLYDAEYTAGAKEANTRSLEGIHMRHLRRLLSPRTLLGQITTGTLQKYIHGRSLECYRKQPIRPQTIRKELGTLQTVWNWAFRQGHVPTECPMKGITFPKGREKPPFRSYEQIEAIVARGGLSEVQIREHWDGLFLDRSQTAEVLEFVRDSNRSTWLYPFLTVAAHTGARRSELLRARVEDFDFANRVVLIREKKRSKERETFRSVDMTQLVGAVMKDYFATRHPGGPLAFCIESNKPIHDGTTQESFRWALRNSKWKVLRGYHVFRHSFATNLAAAGVNEHVVDALMGHMTAEMRARYRHMFPTQRRAAVAAVFSFDDTKLPSEQPASI